jgi:hypothetical protein
LLNQRFGCFFGETGASGGRSGLHVAAAVPPQPGLAMGAADVRRSVLSSLARRAARAGRSAFRGEDCVMCRNIKTLHNFKPPATDDEIRASSLQFVRKLSGFTHPSKANEAAFNRAVDQVTRTVHELLDALVANHPPRDRETEAAKARARSRQRFGSDARRTA